MSSCAHTKKITPLQTLNKKLSLKFPIIGMLRLQDRWANLQTNSFTIHKAWHIGTNQEAGAQEGQTCCRRVRMQARGHEGVSQGHRGSSLCFSTCHSQSLRPFPSLVPFSFQPLVSCRLRFSQPDKLSKTGHERGKPLWTWMRSILICLFNFLSCFKDDLKRLYVKLMQT